MHAHTPFGASPRSTHSHPNLLIEQAAISVKDSLEFTAGESQIANELDLDAWVRTEKRLLKFLQVDGLMQTSTLQSKQQETAMKLRLDCTMKDFRPVKQKASRRASAVAAAAILDQDGSARRKSSGTLPGSPHAGEDEDDEEDEGGHQKKKSAPKPRAAKTVASGRSAAARLTAAALAVDSSDAESVVAAGKAASKAAGSAKARAAELESEASTARTFLEETSSCGSLGSVALRRGLSPLVSAQHRSTTGTPLSEPDRPFDELYSKLQSIETKLSTKTKDEAVISVLEVKVARSLPPPPTHTRHTIMSQSTNSLCGGGCMLGVCQCLIIG